ncbi:endonuclease/exonuclease/phosphatase family protein [Winogradskyella alexanderae]|uniref:Endonuclease/exonuclease/phosphatase family protein n=1 Tax=Winogradskyella alexanderae TaxID=2877123 RepID=A0ABS7XQH8_9FLAO|nr:endonuclease/exonuclease/phosphatase family protein [Winogradskyella alexanderae]MCA0132258.1 endonuclease/exonuclease/phosphatase family protein [Winogradskyella alexanderae]
MDKIIFAFNSLAAFLLLISYLLPFVPPKSFATVSALSLSVPILIILNIFFFIYWLLRIKKQLLISLLVLVLGWSHVTALYKFSSSLDNADQENISIMSFNVRLFNHYNWIPDKSVREEIVKFFENESPDIICLQEYTRGLPIRLEGYNEFNARYMKNVRPGMAMFSKFPIINGGSLDFPDSNNNALFMDVVKGNDTIRVYNIHLQSSGINTNVESLKTESSDGIFSRLKNVFQKQQEQAELINRHRSNTHYKTIITGDFNNTTHSYVYKEIKNDLKDTFEEAGNGFGRTFDFKFFPFRIDFIFVDKAFTVNGFKNYDVKLSDHYPIKAIVKLDQ